MSRYDSYIENEFNHLKQQVPDSILFKFKNDIIRLANRVREDQSGHSIHFYTEAVCSALKNLCLNRPIVPVEDVDDQWFSSHDEMTAFAIENVTEDDVSILQDILDEPIQFKQHSRLSSLFKYLDGTCIYGDAIVWVGEEEFDQFTGTVEGISSGQGVHFPFMPRTFYIDVVRRPYDPNIHSSTHCHEDDDGNEYVYEVKNYKDLEEVFKYYYQVFPNQNKK